MDAKAVQDTVYWLTFRVVRVSMPPLPWPDREQGPFELSVDLLETEGETRLVGLGLRSFTERTDAEGQLARAPLPYAREPFADITRDIVLKLDPERIKEWFEAFRSSPGQPVDDLVVYDKFGEPVYVAQVKAASSTQGRRPRATRAETEALLQRVARIYTQAQAEGGAAAAAPARRIADALNAEGEDADINRARDLIRAARNRGLIPPANTDG